MRNTHLWIVAGAFSAQALFGASLTVTSEKVFGQQKFVDRVESSGIYRDGAVTPHLNSALYLPISIMTFNLNTTFRGVTSDLLQVGFSGDTNSLGRLGDIDQVTTLDSNNLLVQTRVSLSRIDLLSGEQVWKLPLAKSSGIIARKLLSATGEIYLREGTASSIQKLDASTGRPVATITPDKSVGQNWRISALSAKGDILLFGNNRFTLINDQGSLLWQFGKVFPEKTYGSARLLGDGNFVLEEYISAENPSEKLKRRTFVTVVTPEGKEVWSRLATQRILAEGKTILYVQEVMENKTTDVIALDKNKGTELWRRPVADRPYVHAVEDTGRLFVSFDGTVLVLSAGDGKKLASKIWLDRTQTKVHAVKDSVIILSNRQNGEPHQSYLTHLKLN